MKKTTIELERILESTPVRHFQRYLGENADSLLTDDRPFTDYMRGLIRTKKLKQQDVFLEADIPERHGYKLISGESRTRKRDVVLRICYAAHFTLNETQDALLLYGMAPLYSRFPRDAFLMIAFHTRPGSINDINELLAANELEPLCSCGVQE